MRLRYSLGIPVAAALAVVGWLAFQADPPAEEGKEAASKAAQRSGPAVTASGVRGIPASVAPPTSVARAPAAPPRTPTVFDEFLKTKEYRALYDRLRNSAEGETAEGRLVLWEILRNCATVTEGRRYSYRPPVPKREEFIAGIAPADAVRQATTPRWPEREHVHQAAVHAARAALGEAAFAEAWAEGRALSLEQAVAEALADEPEMSE